MESATFLLHWLKSRLAFLRFWRSFIIVLMPLVCLPLVINSERSDAEHPQALKCAYVLAIMTVYWITEALPLAVTSLIPLVLLPMLGIMNTDTVGKEYLKQTNMMIISGIIVALAVEHCNLHKRMALKMLLIMGTSPRRLMFGFMLQTMFLSMWISNTATTSMMVPIVQAVIGELEREDQLQVELEDMSEMEEAKGREKKNISEERSSKLRNIRNMIFLSIAYSANCGGTGTITGTGPNLVLKAVLDPYGSEMPLNFASWIAYNVMPMILTVLMCWVWLQAYYIGIPWAKWYNKVKVWLRLAPAPEVDPSASRRKPVREAVKEMYRQLGPFTFHEGAVMVMFITLVLLWIFRDPQFVSGWGELFPFTQDEYLRANDTCIGDDCLYTKISVKRSSVHDASAGMAIVVLLFIIPAKLNFWPFTKEPCDPSPSLLDWQTIHKKMPWSLVFLLGGGFALAKATAVSGLSSQISEKLQVLHHIPSWAIVMVVVIMAAVATEFASNVATCSILMPMLNNLAISLHVNPIYLMLPVALACSYAFMLPVANPPNAIVYEASGMTTFEMIKVGFVMNVVAVVINLAWLQTFGIHFFDLDEFPEWASSLKMAS